MKASIYLLLPATAFIYYGFFLEEFETGKAFALVSFACFAAFFVRWKQVIKDPVAQSLVLFSLSAAVSTYFSIDWHMSVFGNPRCRMGLLVIVSYLVFYLAARESLCRDSAAKRAIDIVLACSAVVALYAIAQVLGFDFKHWNGVLESDGYTRPMSTLGHPNFMANYLAMALPFAMWRLDKSTKTYQRVLLSILIITFIITILLALSRGMIIAANMGLLVYLFINRVKVTIVPDKPANNMQLKNKILKAIMFFSVVGIIVAISLSVSAVFRHTAIVRLSHLLNPGPARVEYPTAALRIWQKYPWFGSGTDTFELAFQHQRTEHYWHIERAGSPHRAHNDFLNILATQGIFGALAALVVSVAIALAALRSRSPFAAPAIAAIVVFYVAGMTSFIVVATGVLFMLCVALL